MEERRAHRRRLAPRSLSVLIVDDDADAAHMLSKLVMAFGHRTRVTFDPWTAERAFEEFKPDVALLDIGLPGKNGYDLARELRARYGPDVFLAAITGWGHDEDKTRAREAGFDVHISKPADASVIERVLACAAGGDACNLCWVCRGTKGASDALVE